MAKAVLASFVQLAANELRSSDRLSATAVVFVNALTQTTNYLGSGIVKQIDS